MKVVKWLLHKTENQTEIFNGTFNIYNAALSFIIRVIDKELDNTDDPWYFVHPFTKINL